MKTKCAPYALILLVLLLTACGPAATRMAPYATQAPATEAPATQAPAYEAPAATMAPAAAQSAGSGVTNNDQSSAGGTVYEVGEGNSISNFRSASRMIIKNGEIILMVKDTDVAIDGVTQAAGDLGGYIVSSRVWYQSTNGENMKYSTITLGVPVLQFETILRRLHNLAIKVMDEKATGEDVTDQFVDLQSQLQNLQATRDRIRDFLKAAKTVDEALRVNSELSTIEGQIEEIQGRMNYLQDRSAFSTITVTLQPQPPEKTPTPTATPTATPTPTATATPAPWKPGETFNDAGKTLTTAYTGVGNVVIWLLVFVVPILLPPALIIWGIWYLVTRLNKPKKIAPTVEK